jgi:3-deoxy-D-manno-octulosonic-acid transferase
VCAAGFLPLDTIPLMTRVIDYFSISRLWLIETEIWPSLLWVCRKKNIPIGIVNARIEEKPFRYYSKFKNFLTYLFHTVDIILAQNELYATRFNLLGVNPSNIHIVGNIKSQITIKRPLKKEWLGLRKALNIKDSDIVLTAGCIHAAEMGIIADMFSQLHGSGIIDKLIIVPRYLGEVDTILAELSGVVVHLHDIQTSKKWEICVISKTGILDDMYKLADAALIGGTFDRTGGHNIWDAARYGIPVFFGYNYSEQNDGCEMLLTNGVGFKAHDAADLAALVYRVIKKDASKFMHAQRLFSDTINRRQSVLEPLIP